MEHLRRLCTAAAGGCDHKLIHSDQATTILTPAAIVKSGIQHRLQHLVLRLLDPPVHDVRDP